MLNLLYNDLIDDNYCLVGIVVLMSQLEVILLINWLIYYGIIDPHHEKLKVHGFKIPDFFFTLPQYQNNKKYNQFYFTSHHKKELKSDILENLVKVIETCISQPWASKNIWEEFIGVVFDLCHTVRKYIRYLNSVNDQMKDITPVMV